MLCAPSLPGTSFGPDESRSRTNTLNRPLEASEKSLAWRLRFQAPDRTLTEAEIDEAIEAIHAGLATDVGGRIRG